MKYKVSLKNTDQSEIIPAKNELDARMKFCEQRGYLYRVYAPSLSTIAIQERKKARAT